jgi:hypothetical protein
MTKMNFIVLLLLLLLEEEEEEVVQIVVVVLSHQTIALRVYISSLCDNFPTTQNTVCCLQV